MRIVFHKRSHALGLGFVMVVLVGCAAEEDAPPQNDAADAIGDATVPGPSDGSLDADPITSDAHVADAATSSDSALLDATVGGVCHQIASQCVGVDASSSLATTCLEVSESGDVESCEALAEECAEYCQGAVADAGGDGGEPEPAPDAAQCAVMGETCHAFDDGHGLGNLCHEFGHARDLAVCGAIYDECEALCGEFHGDEDAAHGHDAATHSDEDAAHGHEPLDASPHSDAAPDAAPVSDAASE